MSFYKETNVASIVETHFHAANHPNIPCGVHAPMSAGTVSAITKLLMDTVSKALKDATGGCWDAQEPEERCSLRHANVAHVQRECLRRVLPEPSAQVLARIHKIAHCEWHGPFSW